MNAQLAHYNTIKNYLEFEAQSEIRHEYERGEILAMSGGTINHGRLCNNIATLLDNSTKGSKCETFNGHVRLRIEKEDCFVYPDAMVICGKIEPSEKDKDSVTNPVLVIEVLSKSTGAYDRGDKFHKYRQLKSLREYVLIQQEQAIVEVFFKTASGDWQISWTDGLDKRVRFQSIGVEISLKDLYQNVDFEID